MSITTTGACCANIQIDVGLWKDGLLSLLYQISDQPESVAIIPELVMLRVRRGKKSRWCAGMAEVFVAAHYDRPFVKVKRR